MARKKSLSRRLIWGVVGYIATTLGTLLTTYLTSLDVSSTVGSVMATGVGLIVTCTGVLIDNAAEGAEPAPSPPPPNAGPAVGRAMPPQPGGGTVYPSGGYRSGYPAPGYPPQPPAPARRGGMSIVMIMLLIVVLCGGGGFGLAYGAQRIGHNIINSLDNGPSTPADKTKDPGVERIASPASASAGPLTVDVTSVRVNNIATIVTVHATNSGNDALQIPVYHNAQLTVPGANSLSADPFAGTWSGPVPAGGESTGTIVFDGVLGPGVTGITLSFSTIFGGFDTPQNISVDISIKPAG
jgi:hypothetical protein